MNDTLLVLRKLVILREHAERIRRRRTATVEEFQANVDILDATALSLMVVVQEAADMALHIASGEGWGIAASYAEGFELLAAHGVITSDASKAMGRMVALRNRIAHGYASVDAARIWEEIPAGLAVLDSFSVAVAAFAESKAP